LPDIRFPRRMPTAFTVCLNQRAERRDFENVWQHHFNDENRHYCYSLRAEWHYWYFISECRRGLGRGVACGDA
jgi:hypothetical protein